MTRSAQVSRETTETNITLTLALDGSGKSRIHTGVGFFDHMLTHISKHGFMDLELNAEGDLQVDCHHMIEDVGIVLGKCMAAALGTKEQISRYGNCTLPMEEALVLCAVDISGRPLLVFDGPFTTAKIGDMDTEMIEEFFRAVCINAGLNLHIKVLTGKNNHHIAEAMFKAFGRAFRQAAAIDSRIQGVLSTKGMLEG